MAKWDNISGRGNVEDRRGLGGPVVAGGGLVTVLITLALAYFGFYVSPSTVDQVIGQIQSLQSSTVDESQQPVEFRGEDDYEVFAGKVLGSSDELWTKYLVITIVSTLSRGWCFFEAQRGLNVV